MRVTLEAITALGMLISSWRRVSIWVFRNPTAVTVPSVSPICTNSPGRSARVYISIRPLTAWLTMPDAPIDSMRPTNTPMPLKASLPLPGRYGYAATSANSQMMAVSSRSVGRAVASSTQPTSTRPACTPSKNTRITRTRKRVTKKISSTNTQARDGLEHPRTEAAERVEQPAEQPLAPGPRVREEAEHQRQPLVDEQ